jgi:hypothetical protein
VFWKYGSAQQKKVCELCKGICKLHFSFQLCLLYKQAKHVNPKASVPLKPLEENHIYERDYNENSVIRKVVSDHHHLHHE